MTKLVALALLALAAAMGSGSAIAQTATLHATFNNNTSEQQNKQSQGSYWTSLPLSIASFGSGPGTATDGGSMSTSVTYQGSGTTKGCYFTAGAAYVGGSYSFSANSSPFGVYMGQVATCNATITSSNSSTGHFYVSYTISGY
jgi:hypothetical protein